MRVEKYHELDDGDAAVCVGGVGERANFSAWFSFVILHTSSTSENAASATKSRQHAQVSLTSGLLASSTTRRNIEQILTCHIIIFLILIRLLLLTPRSPASRFPSARNGKSADPPRRERDDDDDGLEDGACLRRKKFVNMRWLCDFSLKWKSSSLEEWKYFHFHVDPACNLGESVKVGKNGFFSPHFDGGRWGWWYDDSGWSTYECFSNNNYRLFSLYTANCVYIQIFFRSWFFISLLIIVVLPDHRRVHTHFACSHVSWDLIFYFSTHSPDEVSHENDELFEYSLSSAEGDVRGVGGRRWWKRESFEGSNWKMNMQKSSKIENIKKYSFVVFFATAIISSTLCLV